MAFAAGVISFLSPCVLPLIPGYISFISGVSLEELKGKELNTAVLTTTKRTILLNALSFIIGFSVVFILLGATATGMGSFLSFQINLFTKLAGLVIIFFGVVKLGVIRPLFLFKERKFRVTDRKFGIIGSSVIGASFAFGWTPCIGPILAGILFYAGTLKNMNHGILLLTVYALGLGIPFFLTAMGVNQFFKFFNRIRNYMDPLQKITGVIMILLGLLIFTNNLILIPGYLPFLNKFAL